MLWIVFAIALIIVCIGTIFLFYKRYTYIVQKICGKEMQLVKAQANFCILNRWLKAENAGIRISDELKKNGYKSIAIYGVGEIGIRLFEELGRTDCSVAYCIDKKNSLPKIKTYNPDDELPNVDAIIVTVSCDYNEIERQLQNKVRCPIVPIEKLLCGD